ncbi:hypothetical protein [Candidatus Nanohalococcus occultus]|uniref:hypothetical protein n=1 Tax=Candidatus Nanohalococcus occultus TaxID=2978047 RepID=UPI0039E05020
MALNRKKGQAFILGTVVFTSLFLIALLPSGPQIRSGDTSNIQSFFQKSFNEQKKMFNNEIGRNNSAKHLTRKLYVYNQFIKQSTGLKGGSYRSYQFFVLPGKDEGVFINFQPENIDVSVFDGAWENTTVESFQYEEYSLNTDGNVSLELTEKSHSYEFRAYKPRLVFWMEMRRQTQSVENRYTG